MRQASWLAIPNLIPDREESGIQFHKFLFYFNTFDGCVVRDLLDSFGVAAADISVRTLVDVCVSSEGRRLGPRDRQSLTQETQRGVRDLCIAEEGEAK
jgi:hypothetical protein